LIGQFCVGTPAESKNRSIELCDYTNPISHGKKMGGVPGRGSAAPSAPETQTGFWMLAVGATCEVSSIFI
jgi:hypothetical protein